MPTLAVYCTQPILAEGLMTVLAEKLTIDTLCRTIKDVRRHVELSSPDVLVLELNQDVSSEIIKDLRRLAPAMAIVLWIEATLPAFLTHAMTLGVRGLVRKTCEASCMQNCISSVAAGEIWIDPELTGCLMTAQHVRLTPRERQLLTLVAQGLSNKEMAAQLNLSEGTVKVYMSHLFDKTGTSDRFELALLTLSNLSPTAQGALAVISASAGSPSFSMPSVLITKSVPKNVPQTPVTFPPVAVLTPAPVPHLQPT